MLLSRRGAFAKREMISQSISQMTGKVSVLAQSEALREEKKVRWTLNQLLGRPQNLTSLLVKNSAMEMMEYDKSF